MNILHLLVSVGLLFSACIAEDASPKRNPCGGSLTTDSDVIEYPGDGAALTSGEVCVWTVHLNSTQNFRIRFGTFDVRSTSPDFDCKDSGVRIYSITNLVAPDRLENYTYCSDNLPPSSLIVSGNVISVVVYANTDFPGQGFYMYVDGLSFDPVPKNNLATFTNTPSGLIGYPVVGSYPTSVVATWTMDLPSEFTDVDVLSIGLESCTNPDPCTCDALLVFEVSAKGVLSVRERLCSTSSNNVIQNTPSRFILAFFSDAITQPGSGAGFQLQYVPSAAPPTTTKPDTNIPCGTVIRDTVTDIAYKESEQYGENERCVWTVRVKGASNYRLQIFNYGVTNAGDGITLSGYSRSGFPNVTEEVQVTGEGVYEVRGEIAIIIFHSRSGSSGLGFSGVITALEYLYSEFYSVNYVFTKPEPFTFRYPATGNYNDREFSTFLYAPNSQGNTGDIVRALVTVLRLETCLDSVAVLLFSEITGNWLYDTRVCNGTEPYLVQSRDVILFIFGTDSSAKYEGFQIEFGNQIQTSQLQIS